jgi:2',3'-cyclic-nucleotide 2'-phosphodiesterase (5'-nucleotidase family)
LGIVEKEWTLPFNKRLECKSEYQNYKRTTASYAKKLREEENCDLIIALCHMRMPHDIKLA